MDCNQKEFEFYQNKFCIGQISEDLFEGDLVGKFYRELDAEKQNIFNSFQLDMLQIVDADESTVPSFTTKLKV